ncbi:MAG: hypothetical protein K0Q79_2979 [Flavipsychrobacter sp.]|nr:hypothetical protein [Flavipsychrobacter sp.]
MSSGGKIFLGICTFLPLVFGVWFIWYYISALADLMRYIPQAEENPGDIMQFYFSTIFNAKFLTLCVLSVVTWLVLVIYYILHAVKHVKGDGEKILWILLFIFIGTISFVIYFFMRVVPERPKNEIAGTI